MYVCVVLQVCSPSIAQPLPAGTRGLPPGFGWPAPTDVKVELVDAVEQRGAAIARLVASAEGGLNAVAEAAVGKLQEGGATRVKLTRSVDVSTPKRATLLPTARAYGSHARLEGTRLQTGQSQATAWIAMGRAAHLDGRKVREGVGGARTVVREACAVGEPARKG